MFGDFGNRTTSRRELLKRASCGFGFLALADLCTRTAAEDSKNPLAPKPPHFKARAKRVIFMMEHVAKGNAHKILRNCTLPLTGKRVVQRIITDMGTIDVGPDGLILRELAPGVSVEEIQAATEPTLLVPVPPMVMDIESGSPLSS